MRILNGLTLPWLRADAIVTRVGSDPDDDAGTVLDYLVASEQILQSVKHVTVGTDLNSLWSDHRPIRFRWNGYEANVSSTAPAQLPERGPMGWRFKGTPTASQEEIAQERIAGDDRLTQVSSLIETSGPEMAFNLIMEIVRDAWTAAGIDVTFADGNSGTLQILQMPVSSWFDGTVRAALKQWHALRRRKHKSDMQRRQCQHARRRYELLRDESKKKRSAEISLAQILD